MQESGLRFTISGWAAIGSPIIIPSEEQMLQNSYESFRAVLGRGGVVRLAGAHHPLSGALAAEAGFDALWASSFEISAVQCLPDAGILTMKDHLAVAASIQRAVRLPVVVDCDTGYGGPLNVAHAVREFERSGITSVCIEDKIFPKLNSLARGSHALIPEIEFAKKIEVAKRAQQSDDFFIIARTEALIDGRGIAEASHRCRAYLDAGADAVLVHSRARDNSQILDFLAIWENLAPVFIVPTTYSDWPVEEMSHAGVAGVIYANYGLRATVNCLRSIYQEILETGSAESIESKVASVEEIFELQQLKQWLNLAE